MVKCRYQLRDGYGLVWFGYRQDLVVSIMRGTTRKLVVVWYPTQYNALKIDNWSTLKYSTLILKKTSIIKLNITTYNVVWHDAVNYETI